jgi:hypothetical protein
VPHRVLAVLIHEWIQRAHVVIFDLLAGSALVIKFRSVSATTEEAISSLEV